MAVLLISIGRRPFWARIFVNADLPFPLVITSGFYLHYVEVADHDTLLSHTQLVAVAQQTQRNTNNLQHNNLNVSEIRKTLPEMNQ